MDFILPIIFSIFVAPFVGFGCTVIALLCLCIFLAVKKRPFPKYFWSKTLAVFGFCTFAAPFTLVMGWAVAVDVLTDAGNKRAVSSAREFWQSFDSIEHDLHEIKSENDPAYQKMKLLVDKYVWPSVVVVGARHGNVRELGFNELDFKQYNRKLDTSKLINAESLINRAPKGKFENWLIGSGFRKPHSRDSTFSHLFTGQTKDLAKDLLFSAKRSGKRINVDLYTSVDSKSAKDNTLSVKELLKRHLGGQFFYLVLGDVTLHPFFEKSEGKVEPIDTIHQAFLRLLTPSELKSLEAHVTDNICVEFYKQFKNPYLRSPVLEDRLDAIK